MDEAEIMKMRANLTAMKMAVRSLSSQIMKIENQLRHEKKKAKTKRVKRDEGV